MKLYLDGKGIWIWAIRDCIPNGIPMDIADRLAGDGFSHPVVKIANGTNVPGVDYQGVAETQMMCTRLRERGIRVYGFQYVLGVNPVAEAQAAAKIVKDWNLDGFHADMEGEFDTTIEKFNPITIANKAAKADLYCKTLRNLLPNTPLGLASYRYWQSHPYFPWQIRKYFNVDVPQVYWIPSLNPGWQVQESYRQFHLLPLILPFSPIGSAYGTATPAQIVEFLNVSRSLPGVTGASIWELGRMDKYYPYLYQSLKFYSWPVAEPPPPKPEPPKENTVVDKSEYLPEDVYFVNGAVITGANTSGILLDIPNIPAIAKVVKFRIITVVTKVGAFVALGTGNVSLTSRFRLVGQPQVASPMLSPDIRDDRQGSVLLTSPNKVYFQWDAKGGQIKYWIIVQGYEY